jgi:hypothetical protein
VGRFADRPSRSPPLGSESQPRACATLTSISRGHRSGDVEVAGHACFSRSSGSRDADLDEERSLERYDFQDARGVKEVGGGAAAGFVAHRAGDSTSRLNCCGRGAGSSTWWLLPNWCDHCRCVVRPLMTERNYD